MTYEQRIKLKVISRDMNLSAVEKIQRIKLCPLCGAKNLVDFEQDKFCTDCDWDSIKLFVDLGGMDDINQVNRKHFSELKIPIIKEKQLKEQCNTTVDLPKPALQTVL